ncbi:MAG: hypothetical protein KJN77_06965 [Gammaproteobacteria bacterium]|nr:hypothetical protein [Gammaproteobacteria bacterium]
MNSVRNTMVLVGVAALLLSGCAVSPEVESRRQAIEADIDEILSLPLDPAEYGETKRCLTDTEYRSFRAIDDRHILFKGRKDRLWINTLRGRCPDLRFGDVLVIRQFSSSRMCDADRFQVTDWFDWPWYRRWPWNWGSWGTGPTCTLGKFQPVTADQVAEIEARLEDW